MKLQKFKEKNQQKKGILLFSICCIFLIAGVFLYQSFALFQVEENFNVLNGYIEDPGDLYFAYYVDDKITQDMPTKSSGYILSEKSFCNNGVIISWDEERWGAFVDYTNYKKENSSRTKCTLYFEEKKEIVPPSDTAKDYIIANVPEDQIILDDETEDHNMRFIGANPNNYIDIGDRDADGNVILWRIIGVMNNIKSSKADDPEETKLKIIRSESIGNYSWDSSASAINGGYGVNEWSQAKLMKLLNPGYESEEIGGSFYWNRQNGSCYAGYKNSAVDCSFDSEGLSESSKIYIDKSLWYTAGEGSKDGVTQYNLTASAFYLSERGNKTGKTCSSSMSSCNDNVRRNTTWSGYVGLVSPSDYGYATSGGEKQIRTTCLDAALYMWFNSGFADCPNNNWLRDADFVQWTLTPSAGEAGANRASYINRSGNVNYNRASYTYAVRPVVYLKSNVTITSGRGESTNPFVPILR